MSYSITQSHLIPMVYIGIDTHSTNYTMSAVVRQFLPSGKFQLIDLMPTRMKAPKLENVLQYIKDCCAALGQKECNVICGYEAGAFGYVLYRQLMAKDIPCVVMAPTSLVKSSREKKFKNDRIDAHALAEALANENYSAVYVPDEDDEAVRYYINMRDDHQKMVQATKHQIIAFLEKIGYKYKDGTTWTQKHIDWLIKLPLNDMNRETLAGYMTSYLTLQQMLKDFDDRIKAIASQPKYWPMVSKLRCFLGIESILGLRLVTNIGDFNRMKTAGHCASFLGLTPMENSSSDNIHFGPISKAGNSVLRKKLMEAVWSGFSRGRAGFKSRALLKKQEGCAPEVIAYADRANTRLRKRYKKLAERGKPLNVVACAIARELVCFIWGMMTGHMDPVIRK